jgi:hypothetical protein
MVVDQIRDARIVNQRVQTTFAQIPRVVQINDLPSITPEIVAAASETLVIDPL